MNRKAVGLAITAVAVLIFLVASAVVLFGVTGVLIKGIAKDSDRNTCRASVLAQSIALPVKDEAVDLKCPTNSIKFYNTKVESSGKTLPVLNPATGKAATKFSSLNDDIVNSAIAEQLRLCWWQFGEGKLNFGESFLVAFWKAVDGDNCFVCNEVYFDPEVEDTSFEGFQEYLKTHNPPGQKITYYDYFAKDPNVKFNPELYDLDPKKTAWEEFSLGLGWILTQPKARNFGGRPPIDPNMKFDTRKSYIIYFDREGVADASQKVETQSFFAYVVPSDEIHKYCDSVRRGSPS